MSVMEAGQSVAEQVVDGEPTGLDALDGRLLDQLVGQAKERGVKLAGEGGLLPRRGVLASSSRGA